MPAAQTEYSESHYPNRASTPEFESVLALLKNEWAHAEWTLQEFRGLSPMASASRCSMGSPAP